MFSVLSVFWLPQPGIYEGANVERRNEGYAVDFESSSKSATISSATNKRAVEKSSTFLSLCVVSQNKGRLSVHSWQARHSKCYCGVVSLTLCCTEFVWPGFTVNTIPYFYSGLYALPFPSSALSGSKPKMSTDTLLVQSTQTTESLVCFGWAAYYARACACFFNKKTKIKVCLQ